MNIIYMTNIIWVLIKNIYFYFRVRKEKIDVFTFIMWVILSYGVIQLGVFIFELSFNAFMIIDPFKIKTFRFFYYSVPYVLDFISNFIVERFQSKNSIKDILDYEVMRGALFFVLILPLSFLFSASFWIMIILANFLHWNIAGYQY